LKNYFYYIKIHITIINFKLENLVLDFDDEKIAKTHNSVEQFAKVEQNTRNKIRQTNFFKNK
jgi:hypothetical protein